MIKIHTKKVIDGQVIETPHSLKPDKQINDKSTGSFNWVAKLEDVRGKTQDLIIPQRSKDEDPEEKDINLHGFMIVESKEEIIHRIKNYLNDLLG